MFLSHHRASAKSVQEAVPGARALPLLALPPCRGDTDRFDVSVGSLKRMALQFVFWQVQSPQLSSKESQRRGPGLKKSGVLAWSWATSLQRREIVKLDVGHHRVRRHPVGALGMFFKAPPVACCHQLISRRMCRRWCLAVVTLDDASHLQPLWL